MNANYVILVDKIYLEPILNESGFDAATEMGGLTLYKGPEVSFAQ